MESLIITVGNEVVKGDVLNTHLQTISQILEKNNITVQKHFALRDIKQDIINTLVFIDSKAPVDLVVITGGLGPTKDDLTKEAVCEYLKLPLIFSEEEETRIKNLLESRGVSFTSNNKKQAYLIQGATLLQNKVGIVLGFTIEVHDVLYALMPGPTDEMAAMLTGELIPYLKRQYEKKIGFIKVKDLSVIGLAESLIEEKITPIISVFEQKGVVIATYVCTGYISVRLTCYTKEDENALEKATSLILKELGISVFSQTGESLEEALVGLLKQTGGLVSLAESCTGGLIASRLVSVKGASEVFNFSLVTYSNKAKSRFLGVKAKTLKDYTAVSSQTAIQMLRGVVKHSKVLIKKDKKNAPLYSINLCVTGYLPTLLENKEVQSGLVYISYCINTKKSKGEVYLQKLELTGTEREKMRFMVSQKALIFLYECIKQQINNA